MKEIKECSPCFDEIVGYRRSVRIFDPEADYNPQIITKNLKRAILAPSSSNLQLWEFHRVRDGELRQKLNEACFNQPAARTANELIVIVTRLDKWEQRIEANIEFIKSQNAPEDVKERAIAYYDKIVRRLYKWAKRYPSFVLKLIQWFNGLKKPVYREVSWTDLRISAHKSVALAAQTFMLGMSADGYDTCPMEGFDSKRVKKLLNLPEDAEINMIIACGIRKPEGIYGPRFRIPFEEVYYEY